MKVPHSIQLSQFIKDGGNITGLLGSTRNGAAGDPHTKYLHFIRKSWKFRRLKRETEMGFSG